MIDRRRLVLIAAAVVAVVAGPAGAATTSGLRASEILLRAVATPGLTSYMVPVTFDVHLHRPIGARSSVEGAVYYQSPTNAALVITRSRGLVSRFFRGTYALDLAPQVWAQKYVATSIATEANALGPAYVVHATPRNDPSVDAVTFTLLKATLEPIAADWHYSDGSTIRVMIVNAKNGAYRLPKTETIALALPKYALDATCTYGDYELNADVPPGTFK